MEDSIEFENLTDNEFKLLYAYRFLYKNNKPQFYERWKRVTGEDLSYLEERQIAMAVND